MNKQWINTRVEMQWNGTEYIEVKSEGYWYEGPVADCKKDSAAPDYTPMAEATQESTRVMAEYADNMLAETQRQYDDFAPIAKETADVQLDIMRQSKDQADDYYDYQTETFRPLEKSLVDDVNNYNTEAERERIANTAAVDVERASTGQRQSNARAMASMGVNPNSGKSRALSKQSGLQIAGMKAGAMTNARNRAKDLGYAKKLDAIGIGRNLPGASSAAYGTAINAGNSGVNNASSPANFILNGMGSAAGIAGQGQSMNIQGNSAILNSKTSIANTNANNSFNVMDAVGTGIGAYAAFHTPAKP
jgi:hypothetical protein